MGNCRTLCIAGNWKMNKTAAEAKAMINELTSMVADINDTDIVLCPTFTALTAAVDAAAGTHIAIGAQNVHWAENGAFTGEISADMLKEAGVEYVIIGHSERRQYFGETDETVNRRLNAALAAGLKPIVCVGESLEDREGNKTEDVVGTQVTGSLAGLTDEQMEGVIVAYEPVWAIGTGKVATPQQAQDTHAFIRGKLAELFSEDTAAKVRIQYGGSVKASNAAELLGQEDIDGALVGGASLTAADFAGILTNRPRNCCQCG
ncbi:MAG: triose-phosphate isomerase [Lentisphaeria bacterium]|nr:triose-phosphate isomerase [Lentisphaeria bacterium]